MSAAPRLSGAGLRPLTRVLNPPAVPGPLVTPPPRQRRDRGSASLEFLGVLPILLLVALAGIQLGLVAYTGSQAGTAARAAARAASKYQAGVTGAQAGHAAVSSWLQGGTTISFPPAGDARSVTATATISIPSVIPGITIFGPVNRSATMPKEDVSAP